MKYLSIRINNFKCFTELDFSSINDGCVIVGANNSGKTTLLQAFSAWSFLCEKWFSEYDSPEKIAEDDDQEYLPVDINRLYFPTLLSGFSDLWAEKNTTNPISISLQSSHWKITFEVLYKDDESASVRPSSDTKAEDLRKFLVNPNISPIYVPPLAGIEREEIRNEAAEFVLGHLKSGQPGKCIRNLIVDVSQKGKWQELCHEIEKIFGYKLMNPSSFPGKVIRCGYQHSANGKVFDFCNAASGFLQTLTVLACSLLYKETVILFDEPDAHLHVLLQSKIMDSLQRIGNENQNQLIYVTHSETIINSLRRDLHRVRAITSTSKRREIKSIEEPSRFSDLLKLENIHVVFAQQYEKLIYVEGHWDIEILAAWARILEHPAANFLERNCWIEKTDYEGKLERAYPNFATLKQIVPQLKAVVLVDGDSTESDSREEGILFEKWANKEIENYLLHPEAIVRFLEKKAIDNPKINIAAAKEDMKKRLPPLAIENPHAPNLGIRGKQALSGILESAGLPALKDANMQDSIGIAEVMTQEEIHPEVTEKLGRIYKHLDIQSLE